MRRHFHLPMTLTHLLTVNGKAVAHSLDFDLVAVAATEGEASEKLRVAVKTYVEFGLGKGWDDYILSPAPKKYRAKLTEDTPVRIGPPIEIATQQRAVLVVRPHEALATAV